MGEVGVMDRTKSVFYCTGQAWKLWAIYGGYVALLLVFTGVWFGDSLAVRDQAMLLVSGIAISVVSFAFPCLAIRCPSCRAKWFWRAVSQQASGKGIRQMLVQSTCPVCGKTCRELAKE